MEEKPSNKNGGGETGEEAAETKSGGGETKRQKCWRGGCRDQSLKEKPRNKMAEGKLERLQGPRSGGGAKKQK